MKLSTKAQFGFSGERILALIESQRSEGTYVLRNLSFSNSTPVILETTNEDAPMRGTVVRVPPDLSYLGTGDILRLNPLTKEVRVLYRRNSRHNTLFFTERCNSRCVMCSQPPREVDDRYLVDEILTILPWMAKDTPELGITGGEPTLLGDKLIEVVLAAKEHLPTTPVHILSNGRLFAYVSLARQLGEARHSDLMVGVPLYSDLPYLHDFVVQAKDAFEQTVFGILNLARVGVRLELRMVIHRHTCARLPEFARFVSRNFPFVDQVVLMGLEPIGFARSNLNALWIDPSEYQEQLEQCVTILKDAAIRVSIYNHPLCLLRPTLWRFARRSISDWKNSYFSDCEPCVVKSECAGFFSWAERKLFPNIQPILRPTD